MGTLLNRRRYMGGGSSLPYDAEVDYIESTGTQFIQLSFGFDSTDEIYTEFSVDTSQTSDKYMVCPKTWNNNSNRFAMGVHNNGRYTAAFGSVNTNSSSLTPNKTNRGYLHNWQYKNLEFQITDMSLSKTYSASYWGGTTTDLKLFYGYNSNTKGKMHTYKHVKNGVVVFDAISVRVGQVGYLYDKVSGQLFGSDGTSDFVAGPDSVNGYVELEYLGVNADGYIELDFGFDKTDEVYAEFAVLQGTDAYIVAPSVWNNNNNRFGMGISGNSFGAAYGGTSTNNTYLYPLTSNDSDIHTWQYKDYEFKMTDISPNPSKDVSSITFGGTTSNLRLFYGYQSNSNSRLVSYKHIKNGVVVADLISVRVGNIGKLYDRENNVFYGGLNFILGPDKT